jgi:hypothetical protein
MTKFDGTAFGEKMCELVKNFMHRETAKMRGEITVLQRALDDVREENRVLLGLLGDLEGQRDAATAAQHRQGL